MKILSLKTLTYCFSALLFFSVTFVACADQEEVNNLLPTVEKITLEEGFVLPNSIISEGEAFIAQHVQRASDATKVTYRNNSIAGQYLVAFGKIEEVFNTEPATINLSEIDLKKYLNDAQVELIHSEFTTVLPSSNNRAYCTITKWDPCGCRNQWNQCVGCWVVVGYWC